MHRSRTTIAIAALAGLLALSACGSSDSGVSVQQSETGAPAGSGPAGGSDETTSAEPTDDTATENTSTDDTSSVRGSRANVAGPAYRGIWVASIGPRTADRVIGNSPLLAGLSLTVEES